MNIYFHFQFTGLHKNTTPISLGMWTEQGDAFYAEFIDYDKSQMTDWIKENVMSCLWYKDSKKLDNDWYHIGTKKDILIELKKFLEQYDNVQLVGDCCHYDMILLIDLFGTAFDLPKNISPQCYDINADIAKYRKISNAKAFDESRVDIINEYFGYEAEKKTYNASDMAYQIALLGDILKVGDI